MKTIKSAVWVGVFLMSWAGVSVAGEGEGYEAISRPSKNVPLSFEQAGKVSEVLVKPGDVIRLDGEGPKTEKVVARLDDTAAQARLAMLRTEAENTIRVEAAQAQLDQKRVDLERLEELHAKKVATKWELENGRLEKRIAELSVKLAEFELQQAKLRLAEARTLLERMVLKTQVAGVVMAVLVHPGQSVDALQEVVRLVALDPLWVDVPVPLAQEKTFPLGGSATVHLGDGKSMTGKTIYHAPVADGATGIFLVRVEVPNPELRKAGEKVRVTFGPAAAAATAQ